MKVTLIERQKGKMISMYLHTYHKGKREWKFLNIKLYPVPEKGKLTPAQREHNRTHRELAAGILSKTQLAFLNGQHGFTDQSMMNASFIVYIEQLMKIRKGSNYDNWDSMLKHLKKFIKGDVTFSEIKKEWVESVKYYFENTARSSSNKRLSINTQLSYFNKITAALKQAVIDGIIIINPANAVKGIKGEDAKREYLTQEELKLAIDADCEIPELKKAFLFSVMTGIRWSDIAKLTWSEVLQDGDKYLIRFRQQKTKGSETLPISKQAFNFLGARRSSDMKVFPHIKYGSWSNLRLAQWMMNAGINKKVTFHCARHTYATLQLTLGTDIYTIQKLLGHKHLKTTELYTKVVDQKKEEAANRIHLNL